MIISRSSFVCASTPLLRSVSVKTRFIRHNEIADEIRDITFELTRRYMAETFYVVAKVVLDREKKLE